MITHEEVAKKTAEYLAKGGKIHFVSVDEAQNDIRRKIESGFYGDNICFPTVIKENAFTKKYKSNLLYKNSKLNIYAAMDTQEIIFKR